MIVYIPSFSKPFKADYMLCPSVIIPVHDVKSKTKWYPFFYDAMKPLNPLLMKMNSAITSEQLGKVMIQVASNGYPSPVIESNELKKLSMHILY